jgi:hypothetical protein
LKKARVALLLCMLIAAAAALALLQTAGAKESVCYCSALLQPAAEI